MDMFLLRIMEGILGYESYLKRSDYSHAAPYKMY